MREDDHQSHPDTRPADAADPVEPPLRDSSTGLPRELTDTGQLRASGSGSDDTIDYILPIPDLPSSPRAGVDDDYPTDAPPLPNWPEPHWRVGEHELVGPSDPMRAVFARAASLATSRSPMLITGSAGTGKYTLAHLVHAASAYDPEVFIPLQCGKQQPIDTQHALFGKPLPENQPFGTRLFAHVQPVQWVEAQGGMMLLMNIEYLDHDVQEVITHHALKGFTRGKETVLPGNVRCCFTSMWSYEYLVRFRIITVELEMLLRRNHVHLPLLRDRRDDIPALVECFLQRHASEEHPARPLAAGVLDDLTGYDWPGNVRELEAACRQALENTDGAELQSADFLAARRTQLTPNDLAASLFVDDSATA